MRTEGLRSRALFLVAPLAVAMIAGCSPFAPSEAGFWRYGFRNDSTETLLFRSDGGPAESRIMPAHASQELYLLAEGQSLPVTVFLTDCVGVGVVTLTQDHPYLHVDEAGRVSAGTPEVLDRGSPSATLMINPADLALADKRVCSGEGLHVDVRNDSSRDLLVRLNFKYSGPSGPELVPASSRGGLAASYVSNYAFAEGPSAEVLGADCRPVGTVVLSRASNVIYVDVAGSLSAQPQSAFWEEPPPATFRATSPAASACPGVWATESTSASP